MKKLVCLCLIGLLVCSSVLLIKKISNTKTPMSNKFYENIYTDTSHQNSNIKIRYPQSNNENQEKLNNLIKNYAEHLAEDIYSDDYINLELELSYRIAFHNDDWLSIVFEGLGNISTAAYPNNLIRAININLKDASVVNFSDLYSSNNQVLQIVKNNFHKQFTPEKFGITSDDESYQKLQSQLSTVSIYTNQNTLGDETIFYLSETSVIICPELPHAIGDYFEVKVKYSEIDDFLKMSCLP